MTTSDKERDRIWDRLVDEGIATEAELDLVTDIAGFSKEVLLDVLYCRTGYRNFEQLEGEE